MYRKNLADLKEWIISTKRKPLIIRGARQVGKTWLVRKLANETGKLLIELNLEKEPKYAQIFASNDVRRIITDLESVFNKKINLEATILFIDEIQVEPQLLPKLRWFYEDLPELAVVVAGSLLDFALAEHSFSMPVGRISYMYLQPMSFEEFLIATDRIQQYEYLNNWHLEQNIPEVLHNSFCSAVREYVLVGGLPESVNAWCDTRSFIDVNQVQQDLITTYRDDFTKYASRINKDRLEEVLLTVPSTLGYKFQYSRVNDHVQSSVVKHALNLLVTARLVHKIYNSAATGLPLKANINIKFFKITLIDIGLVSAFLKLSTHTEMLSDKFSLDNAGGIAEQYVAQALLNSQPFFQEPEIFYWAREDKNSSAEVDYIIQHGNTIIPIEVKAGSTGTLRSLHLMMKLRHLDFAVRFNNALPSLVSTENFKLLSVPFYMAGQLNRLLDELKS